MFVRGKSKCNRVRKFIKTAREMKSCSAGESWFNRCYAFELSFLMKYLKKTGGY